ncbi:SusC/RagA family TonB-linked outer membrane protein [Cyclobacterium marinum]|uniref:TonB-dependent receptor plug n=1 Tax=Cyclobacterium marinum (strain ATCC 25205 / DSM 745 / LMG 13164 / NCIMB 1802) TaxID=880070 RepID=G0J071_CYCMS|nr:TonB-dependent receptor [Cyclobacterium marinum]AEL27332.1 TonB-dependent receptor plug [Cyclobacterium marinum DSM 745]
MKKKLLKTIMILSKGFLYGLVFQMLVVNFTSVIQAKGQYKSIEEVEVTLSGNKLGVFTFFEEVKRQTSFRFSYDKKSLNRSKAISFSSTNGTVEDFLIEVSHQSNLFFRQFNNTIDVKMVNREIVIKDQFLDPITISGTVKDATGEPLPGATISVMGGNKGTVTGIDGTYSIEVETGVTLVFSYIGFQNQSFDIGNQTTIDVTLLEDESSLEEVVVVGYGTVNKRDLTSAISQVSGKEIESRFTSRIDEALQGKLAGVSVQQTSGLPGAAPVIRIRGTSSITEGNQPLWVVDGMPIEDANIIANINMSDAESVEVLKDAAAAAIYGSRASNGVVIITTKKGKSGKPNISYNMRYGIQEPEKLVDFVSGPEHAEILAEWRSWRWESTGGDPNLPNASRPANMRIDPNWLTGDVPDHNIQDLLFQTATIQNHNVSLSGGSDNTTYFMSLDYMDQEGIAVGTSFERFSLRTNIESRVTDLITIGLNMAGSTSTQIDANSEGKDRNINVSLRNGALVDASDYYFLDNGFLFRNDYSFEYGLGNSSKSVYELNNLQQKFTRPQALINTHIDFNLIDGLVFKVAGYYRYNSLKFSDRRDAILGGGNPVASISNEYQSNWTLESTLNYNKKIGKHAFTGLLGYSSQKDYSEFSSLSGRGFPNDLSLTLNNASEISNWNENINEWSLISMFARATYGYDSRYLVTASTRRDGSSRFGTNNKWGLFPSVSAAWNISNETFLRDNSIISNLKLRASYGKTGNNRIGNYRHYATLANANAVLGSGEVLVSGLTPGGFENRDLTWERTATTNIGIDLGFFSDRINLSIDAYEALTDDLLLSTPLPLTTGFSSTILNVGDVSNKGIEIELNTRNITTSDFQWSTTFNYSFNKNEVLKMGQNDAPIIDGEWYSRVSYTGVGEAIGSFYMWEADGIFQNEAEVEAGPIFKDEGVGDVRFKDQDGDGDVDEDDRKIVGQPMPKWQFGLTNNLSYKDFDFSIFINGSGGHQIYNAQARYYDRASAADGNLMSRWADRWRSEANPGDGITPKISSTTGTNGTDEEQDAWLYDADWWRIKNITLGYNLPETLLSKIKVSRLRVYVSADNLFLNTDYVGYNTEGVFAPGAANRGANQTEASASGSWGYDFGTLPLPRTFAVGLNLTF